MDCTEFESKKSCKGEDLCKWNKNKKKCVIKPCSDLKDKSTCEMNDSCDWDKKAKSKCFTSDDECMEMSGSSKKACKEIGCKWKKKSKKCKAKK